MADNTERLDESVLFLACTRPAFVMGVPMEAMGVNVIVTSIIQTLMGPAYALLGVVIHVLFRAIVRHDHNAFSVLFAWFNTMGLSRNTPFWGGFSLTPTPVVRTFDDKEFGNG